MKKEVNVWDYAGLIMKQIDKGLLLTTAAEDKRNTMVIGWGHLGVIWYKPVFVVYVRDSRYTKELLEQNGEFTVSIPLGQADKDIVAVCGTKSGRDMDKFAALGLETESGLTVATPGIRQMPLTLECKVIYKQAQDPAAIDPASYEQFYAKGSRNEGDHHTAYYGEITAAYIIE